jgi:hypothetical protein
MAEQTNSRSSSVTDTTSSPTKRTTFAYDSSLSFYHSDFNIPKMVDGTLLMGIHGIRGS